jgi:hypothetical protein
VRAYAADVLDGRTRAWLLPLSVIEVYRESASVPVVYK